jgi:O-acetyl-ADP-ribose deacetylase (regulator of RNase III)
MALKTHYDDLLENVKEGIIVHGCNAQGKMRSGFAKQLRATYPKAYNDYKQAYDFGQVQVGRVVLSEVPPHCDKFVIANAITQQFYGTDKDVVYVDYDAISTCFMKISRYAIQRGISQLHFPKIGAGLANGDWDRILKIIQDAVDPSIELNLWIKPETPQQLVKE